MERMVCQAVAACFGTIAFSIFFRVPAKHFPTCGGIGAAAWIVYLVIFDVYKRNMAAVFLASLTVVLLSRFFSVRHKCPLISYLIPGIFPLVPGTGIYFTVYAAISGEYMQAVASFVSAFKGGFAIAIAVVGGIIIPTRYIVWLNGRLQWRKKPGK